MLPVIIIENFSSLNKREVIQKSDAHLNKNVDLKNTLNSVDNKGRIRC